MRKLNMRRKHEMSRLRLLRRFLVVALALAIILCVFMPWPSAQNAWHSRDAPHTSSVLSRVRRPTENRPLRELCQQTTWRPDVYIMCDHNTGGIGNIQAFVLSCVRSAIQAGASIVLPKILARNDEDIGDVYFALKPFSSMLNERHFKAMLQSSCPDMQVLDDIGQINDIFKANVPGPACITLGRFDRRDWPVDCHVVTLRGQNATSFQAELYGSLGVEPQPGKVTLVRLFHYYFAWPSFLFDSPDFVTSFGNLLMFHDEIYELAEMAYSQLLRLSPSYLGVHMRTESDTPAVWPQRDQLRNSYMEVLLTANFPAIYIASGDRASIDSFCKLLTEKNANVGCYSKDNLLDAEQKRALGRLSFDQQALLDYILLLKSSYFMGSAWSSYSHLVALSRHVTLDHSPFPFPKDALSEIVGDAQDPLFRGVWPLRAGL